ncbi:MAG: nucleotidyl transferase AbiEii/AbiGii toxin family protein [Patescibacteria group bacterium]|jgi:predicted nucleotidyltransferase component of viral defense system
MALDYPKHKNILLQILKDIFSDTTLAPHLGFKGGTAALLFYGLDRNSVDLDFDLLNPEQEDYVFERIKTILKKYGQLKEVFKKRFNLLYILSYDNKVVGAQNVKLEINRRNFGASYKIKTVLGISMLVMTEDDMFANKLMAMYERIGRTSRDIYDVYFFSKNNWPINKELINARSGMPLKKLLVSCLELLDKLDNRHILDGLGELLIESQKDWAKAKLKSDTIFLLKLALENEK